MGTFMKNFREWLGIIVIAISVIALGVVGFKIVAEGKSEDYQFVYSSLLPLVGTWVGVVLAFYFGKENYEAASKRYEKIIEKLSPDILDDVAVNQVMISKKTMVSKTWSDVENKTVKEIIDFLVEIDKSRLPILDENGNIKYIVHASLLTKYFKDAQNQVQATDTSQKMSVFVKEHLNIVGAIELVSDTEILENVRRMMNSKPNCKDVFVINSENVLVGWLTDTLILRYINSKKI